MTTWTDAVFDDLAQRTDPEADVVADAWFHAVADRHGDDPSATVAAHRQLWRLLHNPNSTDPTEDVVPDVRVFLAARPALPAWHDPALLGRGQAQFRQWAPEIGLGLFVASLPAGYAAPRGAAVLAGTGRLVDDVRRRVFETAQFLVHLMEAGSIEPGGSAYRDARRIRLVHAAVRHLLSAHGWDSTERKGLALNQEDLLGTLWTFGLVSLDVLAIDGVSVAGDEAHAYLHLWQVVGVLMGIDASLFPMTMEDAHTSFDRIRERQYGASEDGSALVTSLIELIRRLLPGHFEQHLAPAAIRHYAGDRVADLLGLAGGDGNWIDRQLFSLGRELGHFEQTLTDDSSLARGTTRKLGHLLWKAIADAELHGDQTAFEMPESLASILTGGTR